MTYAPQHWWLWGVIDPDWDMLEINWAEGVKQINWSTRQRKARQAREDFEEVTAYYESLRWRFNREIHRLEVKRKERHFARKQLIAQAVAELCE